MDCECDGSEIYFFHLEFNIISTFELSFETINLTTMAAVNQITLDVYEIDGQPTRYFTANFPSGSQVLPYYGTNPNLYAIIIGDADGRHYGVVQTAAAIKTAANA